MPGLSTLSIEERRSNPVHAHRYNSDSPEKVSRTRISWKGLTRLTGDQIESMDVIRSWSIRPGFRTRVPSTVFYGPTCVLGRRVVA